jgi:hypothetical protein
MDVPHGRMQALDAQPAHDEAVLRALQALPGNARVQAAALLRLHLPEAVAARVEAGHADFINEIRVCTVLFIGFPSLQVCCGPHACIAGRLCPAVLCMAWAEMCAPYAYQHDRYSGHSWHGAIDRLLVVHVVPPVQRPRERQEAGGEVGAVQAAMEGVQGCMRGHGGSLLQLRCDEKGFLAICAFGLPGRAHEDDPRRGVAAALDTVEALRARGEVSAREKPGGAAPGRPSTSGALTI